MEKNLIVDDEQSICDSLTFALEDDYEVISTQDPDEVRDILENKKISSSLKNLKQVINRDFGIQGIIGRSQELNSILSKINKVKDLDITVLITGESGTGKDLIAKALHFESNRKDENMEIINCAAIPSDLLESELFGYEKGAFTGAERKKLGKFQLADKGTLFLDEIGEMDLKLQVERLVALSDKDIIGLEEIEKQSIEKTLEYFGG